MLWTLITAVVLCLGCGDVPVASDAAPIDALPPDAVPCRPSEPPDYTSYPVPAQNCGNGAVSYAITQWTMDESEPGVLRVSATLAHFPALEGTLVPFDCSGTFSVSSRVDGACCEIYALAGSFDGEDSWTGTFAAQYCDSPVCGCTAGDGQSCQEMGCTDQSVQLVGTR